MPIERPQFDFETVPRTQARSEALVPAVESVPASSPAPVELEGQAFLDDVEQRWNARSDEDTSDWEPETNAELCAVRLLARVDEETADWMIESFEALPQATQEWLRDIMERQPHMNLRRFVREVNDRATFEHAAALRAVGW